MWRSPRRGPSGTRSRDDLSTLGDGQDAVLDRSGLPRNQAGRKLTKPVLPRQPLHSCGDREALCPDCARVLPIGAT